MAKSLGRGLGALLKTGEEETGSSNLTDKKLELNRKVNEINKVIGELQKKIDEKRKNITVDIMFGRPVTKDELVSLEEEVKQKREERDLLKSEMDILMSGSSDSDDIKIIDGGADPGMVRRSNDIDLRMVRELMPFPEDGPGDHDVAEMEDDLYLEKLKMENHPAASLDAVKRESLQIKEEIASKPNMENIPAEQIVQNLLAGAERDPELPGEDKSGKNKIDDLPDKPEEVKPEPVVEPPKEIVDLPVELEEVKPEPVVEPPKEIVDIPVEPEEVKPEPIVEPPKESADIPMEADEVKPEPVVEPPKEIVDIPVEPEEEKPEPMEAVSEEEVEEIISEGDQPLETEGKDLPEEIEEPIEDSLGDIIPESIEFDLPSLQDMTGASLADSIDEHDGTPTIKKIRRVRKAVSTGHSPEYQRALYTTIIKANEMMEMGKVQEAIEVLHMVYRDNPEDDEILYHLGNAYFITGDLETAYDMLKKATKLNPGSYRAYNNLGVILQKTGHFEEAIRALNHALELNQKYERSWYNLGSLFMDLDPPMLNEAVIFLKRAIEIDPDYTKAREKLKLCRDMKKSV